MEHCNSQTQRGVEIGTTEGEDKGQYKLCTPSITSELKPIIIIGNQHLLLEVLQCH